MPLNGWQTALAVVGGVVGGAALLWPVGIWWEVGKCEKPKYEVLRALASAPGARRRFGLNWSQAAELRRYAPMLIAEVEVEGTMREASSQGFRKIARFIFGGNTAAAAAAAAAAASSEPIAMTSPVRQELVAGGDAAAGGASKGRSEPIAMTSPVVMEMAGGSEALAATDSGRVRMSFVMPSKYTAATLPKPNDATVAIKEVPAATVAALSWRGHVRGREVVERRKRQLLDIMASEGLEPEGDLVLLQYHPPFTYGWQRVNEVTYKVKQAAAEAKAAAEAEGQQRKKK